MYSFIYLFIYVFIYSFIYLFVFVWGERGAVVSLPPFPRRVGLAT